jgi:hypothetical protein
LYKYLKQINLLDALRADKVGDEFNIQYTIVGSGDEYERIADVKNPMPIL